MDVPAGAILEDIVRQRADIVHQVAALAHINKAAGDDIGSADDVAVVDVQRRDDDDQAVLTQMLTVAQNDRSDVADAETVDKDLARGDRLALLDAVLADLDHPADIADVDVLRRHTHRHRERTVLLEHLLLAVDGNEVLRLDQRMDELQLLLARVTGDVHLVHALIYDLTPALQELVDDVADGALVAGDGLCGNDDEIARADRDLAVVGISHARERGHRLALRAGGREDDLLRRIVFELVDINDHVVGHVDVAQLLGNLHIVDHGAAGEGELAAILNRAVDDLLDAADIGREGRDDDALMARGGEELLKAVGDLLLRGRIAGTLGVGALREQREHTLVAESRKAVEVGHPALDGGVVDLEVAGVDDHTRRSVHRDGDSVRDAVVDVDQLDVKAAELYMPAGVHLDERRGRGETVLLQFVLDQTDGQRGAVDRHVHLREQIRDAADMVLMAVGDDHAADAVAVLLQIGEIRDDQIDAEHIAVGERHTAVNDHDIALALKHGEVLADLVETAEEGDLDRRLGGDDLLRLARLLLLIVRRNGRLEHRSLGSRFCFLRALVGRGFCLIHLSFLLLAQINTSFFFAMVLCMTSASMPYGNRDDPKVRVSHFEPSQKYKHSHLYIIYDSAKMPFGQ